MKMFRLRFVTQEEVESDIIRDFTRSLWSHTETVLEDGSYLGALMEGGVQIRPANYCTPKREMRYAIPVEDDQYVKAMDFAHAQIGKGYNKMGILGLTLDTGWSNSDEWFCSQLETAISVAGGFPMLNVLPNYTRKITPEMLHLSQSLIGRSYYVHGM
jgi:hypothetical protein